MSFNSPSAPRSSDGRSLDDLHGVNHPDADAQDDFGLDLVDELSEHPEEPANRPVKKWMLVAGMLAILVVGGIVLLTLLTPKDSSGKIVDASDAQTSTEDITNGGSANIVISESEDGIAVQALDLPVAPEGFDYQWSATASDGSIRLLDALEDDKTDKWVSVHDLARLDDLTLSLETDGGLDVPEGEPLVVIATP